MSALYVNLADPVRSEPLRVAAGTITAPHRPGLGIAWDAAAVRRYRLS